MGRRAQVRQELAQIERRLGLADRIKVHQLALSAVEDHLGVGIIAVAETRQERVGLLGVRLDPLQPGLELRAQLGRDALNFANVIAQPSQVVVERAAAAKRDIRAMQCVHDLRAGIHGMIKCQRTGQQVGAA